MQMAVANLRLGMSIALWQGPRLQQRLQRIKKRCLDISKENGRPNKQKEVGAPLVAAFAMN
jgi:hypothetical protein